MQRLLFYIFYPFIWLISKSPFIVLYFISDILFLLVFYIIGYRKSLVLSNLKRAFPNKTIKELLKIRRQFYHHFMDIIVEMLKTFTISNKEITKRYKYKNISLLDQVGANGKSIIIVGSHYGNWEWSIGMSAQTSITTYGTYTEINNKLLEKKIKNTRARFGGKLLKQRDTVKEISKNYIAKNISIYGLLSDQSPQLRRSHYWTDFLGVYVPIHTGAEMLAKRYDCAFVHMEVTKLKRGYYEVVFELISDKPKEITDFKLTDIFLKKVEKQIRKQPEYYLWTHNRFKHEGKEKK